MFYFILVRISIKLEPELRREQAGFRTVRSFIDLIKTLQIISEQSVERQAHLYLVSIDFKHEFDRVNHHALQQVLMKIGIPEKS